LTIKINSKEKEYILQQNCHDL